MFTFATPTQTFDTNVVRREVTQMKKYEPGDGSGIEN